MKPMHGPGFKIVIRRVLGNLSAGGQLTTSGDRITTVLIRAAKSNVCQKEGPLIFLVGRCPPGQEVGLCGGPNVGPSQLARNAMKHLVTGLALALGVTAAVGQPTKL